MAVPVADRGYARPDLLAETQWLARRLDDDGVRVVDARSPDDYGKGHIPGAVNLFGFNFGGLRTTPEMPDADDFARLVGGLGVGSSTTVVVYDAAGPTAGMVAWAFLYYGHAGVRLLDGGITKWTAEGLPLSQDVPAYAKTVFTPMPIESVHCTLDQAKASVGKQGTVLWDTRSLAEVQGQTAYNNPPDRLGRLPGAVHLEWRDLFDSETNTLKPAREAKALLASKGITPEMEVVSY